MEPSTPRPGARIELRNLTVRRGGNVLVDRVDLEIEPSELLVLIGPSGAGKTTLLSTLNRLIEPSEGEVLIDGVAARGMPAHVLRRSVGYCFQGLGLFPHLDVARNIGITPRLLGWSEAQVRARVDELLQLVGLDAGFARRLPSQLSGGQAQRVAVARALAARPRLLLLDEPFGALDPQTRAHLQDELRSLQSALGTTTVFVSHDLSEALLLADRIAVLAQGRVLQLASPSDIVERPADEIVAQLIAPALQRARALAALGGVS